MGNLCCRRMDFHEEPYIPAQGIINTPWDGNTIERVGRRPTLYLRDVLRDFEVMASGYMETPSSVLSLMKVAECDAGFIQIIQEMISCATLDHRLETALIPLVLELCPLPSLSAITTIMENLELTGERANILDESKVAQERNICVIMGSLSQRFVSSGRFDLLSNDALEYFFVLLRGYSDDDPTLKNVVAVHSLLALEKFASTAAHKNRILKKLEDEAIQPLLRMEQCPTDHSYLFRELAFCSRWSLDNVFYYPERQYSYMMVDLTDIHVNLKSIGQNIKMSADGLEARCDNSTRLESVGCNFQFSTGIWYFECQIITNGAIHIGISSNEQLLRNNESSGIGDDRYSVSYDGCRCLIWHNSRSEQQSLPSWKQGDIVGCLINVTKKYVVFSLNGTYSKHHTDFFHINKNGIFAAATYMAYQQCTFNFGHKPFGFPPNIEFNTFNEKSMIKAEPIIPMHIMMTMESIEIQQNACVICCVGLQERRLIPCKHEGYCIKCAAEFQKARCPICRGLVEKTVRM